MTICLGFIQRSEELKLIFNNNNKEVIIMAKILITGGSGTIGLELTRYLSKHHDLTVVDYEFNDFPDDLKNQVQLIEKDLIDPNEWNGLLNGIEYIIQLAGQPDPDAEFYGDLLELNYKLPHNLFEEAKKTKSLKRVIFASSIHVVDAYPEDVQVSTSDTVRPGDLYGVSKVYLEGLAAYHAYVNGIESIGIRIGNYHDSNRELKTDEDKHGLAMYLSYRDMNHLIDCCIESELEEPFLIVNGLSNNTFLRLSLEEARIKLGYQPEDNAFEMNNIL